MSFPLAEWIDRHARCRHNLANSGMIGTIPPPIPTSHEIRSADPEELCERLAEDLHVDARRLFLTTGASQANSLAVIFLARSGEGRARSKACRVCFPEYPPLFDVARWAGFRPTSSVGAAELAVISQPRNPEGDLWDRGRFLDWCSGARSVLVDETFREFAGTRSLLDIGRPGPWVSGSFTKFYAADPIRVGFLVVPDEEAPRFATFHGVVANLLSSFSVAGALRALRDRETTRKRVRALMEANRAAVRAAWPDARPPLGPVMFDRPASGEGGDALANRALDASVLVCPGSYFGDPTGVRICLTRRSFPQDLEAYLRIRDGVPERRTRTVGRRAATARFAPRRPGGTGRARASPSSRD